MKTAHGQTFLDTFTGEMIVIDYLEMGNDGLLNSPEKSIKNVFYSNHSANYISMKIMECKNDTSFFAQEYSPGATIKAVFPNDPLKVYQLELRIDYNSIISLICINPDETKQSFLLINQNKKPQGNAIDHIRENWSGDFCIMDPKHPPEKISIDLNTRPFKANYYGNDKAKPIPLLISDINTKDFTFTLAFPAKPKEIYRCKITSVHFYATFELINPDGRKQQFSKMDCHGWGK